MVAKTKGDKSAKEKSMGTTGRNLNVSFTGNDINYHPWAWLSEISIITIESDKVRYDIGDSFYQDLGNWLSFCLFDCRYISLSTENIADVNKNVKLLVNN